MFFWAFIFTVIELLALPLLVLGAVVGRRRRGRIDVGLGPEPLINNIYHRRALERRGYSAETYVNAVYFITDAFQFRGDRLFAWLPSPALRSHAIALALALRAMLRYRALYISFNGGPLGQNTLWLWRLEPRLLRLAGVKTVILPYGGDVQDMRLCSNFTFKHVLAADYPANRRRTGIVRRQVQLWTRQADHLTSGCEWVDYMGYWDTLLLAHFSIDTDAWADEAAAAPPRPDRPLRILHAPNHRAIKGTAYFIAAVEALRAEGVPVELQLVEKVPNDQVRAAMRDADVIADQLIVGWYAMFALEGMAMRKPVLCYLRPDLKLLYERAGLVQPGEIPVVECSPESVKEVIRDLVARRAELPALGERHRAFAVRHHSLEAVGGHFDRINRQLQLR